MAVAMQADWLEANQRLLMGEVASVRAALEHHTDNDGRAGPVSGERVFTALDHICLTFGLSTFERKILVMCAGVELEGAFADVCPSPTFGLALATFDDAHWSALSPHAPLRHWSLVTVGCDAPLTASTLRIDEAILHELAGVPELDMRLRPLLRVSSACDDLAPSQREPVNRIARLLRGFDRGPSLVQITGRDPPAARAVAHAAFAAIEMDTIVVDARALPHDTAERERATRAWAREYRLHGTGMFLDAFGVEDAAEVPMVVQFAESACGAIAIGADRPFLFSRRTVYTVEIEKPTRSEQRTLWERCLPADDDRKKETSAALAGQFDFTGDRIRACAEMLHAESEGGVPSRVWSAACASSRAGLDTVADRLESASAAAVLVLPSMQREALRDIVAHARNRSLVYEEWKMGRSGARGLGLSALFHGPSGTGKTLAAEAIGAEIGVDVYRIDLSQLVSKYIGETEKNLRRVFDAAEDGGAVLLFDECDALFGKRGEVQHAHDRYANIEISYLLQRMEAYRGVAILTTNMRSAIDAAFLRRIRFVVAFPFPDFEQRLIIWQRSFPPEVPTENIDFGKVAKLNVAGGNIRNIALYAAFLAADAGEPVRMEHILHAARAECIKIERAPTELEIGAWV